MSLPDNTLVTRCLEKLEFYAAIDFFLNDTAWHADVADHPGTPQLFEHGTFNPDAKSNGPFYFPDCRARFNVADYRPPLAAKLGIADGDWDDGRDAQPAWRQDFPIDWPQVWPQLTIHAVRVGRTIVWGVSRYRQVEPRAG